MLRNPEKADMQKFITLLFIGLLSIQLIAQPQNAEKRLQQLVEKTPAVGLAVVVVKNNKIIYKQSLGYKNLENNQPLTDH